jgi:DNA replication and repair protein RecF
MLSACKSYFNAIDYQLILHGESSAALNAEFYNGQQLDIQLIIEQGKKKKLKLNGKQYDKLIHHIGLINVVIITPDDIELIKGNSDERRKFIDLMISQTDRVYLNHLSEYHKLLDQRNRQLKLFADHQHFDSIILESFNERMLAPCEYIHQKRQTVLKEIQAAFNQYYRSFQSGSEEVVLKYESALNSDSFEILLKSSLNKDLAIQRTSVGIHKDDILFEINGYPLKKFGSQGQNKSFIIALKLAQYHFLAETVKQSPILLLDDIFEKIDEERAEKLIHLISQESFGQIIITDTHAERMRKYFENSNKSTKFVEL